MKIREELVYEFINLRKRFSKLEWFELNKAVDIVLKEKADNLELDDLDIQKVIEITTQ